MRIYITRQMIKTHHTLIKHNIKQNYYHKVNIYKKKRKRINYPFLVSTTLSYYRQNLL